MITILIFLEESRWKYRLNISVERTHLRIYTSVPKISNDSLESPTYYIVSFLRTAVKVITIFDDESRTILNVSLDCFFHNDGIWKTRSRFNDINER